MLEKSIILTSGSEPTDSILTESNGMIDIAIDHWGKVSCRTDAIIDRLNIINGNVYHTEEECKEAHERKSS